MARAAPSWRPRLAVLGVLGLQLGQASWIPRPFHRYRSEPGREGTNERRYYHEEVHALEDGTDLALRWEVEVDPAELYAVDIEHQRGVRVLECGPDRLLLRVPSEDKDRVARWRHVTASRALHGCAHLPENDLYHRVERVVRVTPSAVDGSPAAEVELFTRELHSPSSMFPHCHFSFMYMPAEAKEPHYVAQRRLQASTAESPAAPPRKLFKLPSLSSMIPDQLEKQLTSDQMPQVGIDSGMDPSTHTNSVFHIGDVPAQVSHLSWNYDYEANTTKNPQFKYLFPGGKSFLRLYQPYMDAHFGLTLNFTSRLKNIMEPPHVQVNGELKGYADFNADIAAAINFDKERSATVLNNVLEHIEIPGIGKISMEERDLSPLKFYIGPMPLTIQPRWQCKLKAYHVGTLQGSLRFGLRTTMQLHGTMEFDTNTGMQVDFGAKMVNVSFTPPTWMLFTEYFELGVLLQPEFWMKGALADMKDMEYGIELRPFMNVSIQQEGAEALSLTDVLVRGVAIYPYRVVGLPQGKSYTIGVNFNSVSRYTSNQLSSGITEFLNNVGNWYFGDISQDRILGQPIKVALLEEGKEQPVATGQVICSNTVNGICAPSPSEVKLLVDGQDVIVHLAIVWSDNALSVLESKFKAVTLSFPEVAITSQALVEELSLPSAQQSAKLQFSRNGRTYIVELEPKGDGREAKLEGEYMLELGPQFLDSWKEPQQGMESEQELHMMDTRIRLAVNDKIVATGKVPEIAWDAARGSTNVDSVQLGLETIPVSVELYNPTNPSEIVGSAQITVDVVKPSRSAFWVDPYEDSTIIAGKAYTFHWTTHVDKEGTPLQFNLTAFEVMDNGFLQPTSWVKSLTSACQNTKKLPMHRYNGNAEQCVYTDQLTIPISLADKHIAMVAWWVDDAHWKQRHKMVSFPISVVQQGVRRLALQSPWGVTDLGETSEEGFSPQVKEKLAKLQEKACKARPMKYGIEAGVDAIQHVRNVMMPMSSGALGTLSETPEWDSKPIQLFDLGNGRDGAKDLNQMLPKSVCEGGACYGILPGCQKKKVNPIGIKQVVFRINRLFKWKEHVGPKMRHAIAYGLAVLPDAIEVSEKQIKIKKPAPKEGTAAGDAAGAAVGAAAGAAAIGAGAAAGAEAAAGQSPAAAAAKKPEPAGPCGAWLREVAANGHPYYFNAETGENTWERPACDEDQASAAATAAPAPSPAAPAGAANSPLVRGGLGVVANAPSPAPTTEVRTTPERTTPEAPTRTTTTTVEETTTTPTTTKRATTTTEEATTRKRTTTTEATTTEERTTTKEAPPTPKPSPKPALADDAQEGAADDGRAAPAPAPAPAPSSSEGAGVEENEEENTPFEMVMPFSKTPVRRLLDFGEHPLHDDEDADEDGEPFDQFTVTVTRTMNYELTRDLIQLFLDRGSLRFEDGREDTHGPITVTSFELRDHPAAREAADHVAQRSRVAIDDVIDDAEVSTPVVAAGRPGAFAATAAAAAAVLGAAALFSMRAASPAKARYASVVDAESLANAQAQPMLTFAGYNPLSRWESPERVLQMSP